mgnify:CR=1 FL=1
MPERYERTYAFSSQGASEDAFEVVRVSGVEGLSRPYRFDISLLSSKKDLDLATLAQSACVFTMRRKDGDLPFHGVPALFEMRNAFQNFVFYRVVLVPRLWRLTLTRHNQIFLDKNIQGFLTDALTDGGLTEDRDFAFKLQKSYPAREYVCQYKETHFNFISRWMERDGLYYYFEQHPAGEKLIITDSRAAHQSMTDEPLKYLPPSGLDWPVGEQAVKRLARIRGQVPQTASVNDYNYRTPSARLHGQAEVSPRGRGERRIFGEHVFTESEAGALAKVRAEELACRENLYEGLSSVPHVRSGYLMRLTGHFRDSMNQSYLTVEARHEGGQEAYLAQALGISLAGAPDMPYYRNTFTAIPANVQYRARRTAEKPRFYGVMNAKVDAAQSGEYAELDSQGRYKIILPFDLSGRKDGKASSYVRMRQPYGGSDMGVHFPLHKGCEVLLTFMDGDPDRPVIQAAAPNPEHKSLVSNENNTMCMLTTGGGNKLHIENKQGSERVLMQSPTSNSWARCGHPNDPASERADDQLGWKLNTNGTMLVRAGLYNEMIIGTVEWEYIGNFHQSVLGESLTVEGFHKLLGLTKSVQINLKTLIMRAVRERQIGEQVALDDECVMLAGELKKVRANVDKIEQMRNTLTGQRDTITGTRQQLDDMRTALEGNVNTLTEQHTALRQEVSRLAGERRALIQAKQELGQANTTLDGQKQTLTQQKTLLATNETEAGVQKQRLHTMHTELCEMHSIITAFQQLD